MVSIEKRLEDLEIFQEEFLAGLYPQRPAIGPNSLSKTAVKAKSITSAMISVSNLESVSANTGDLSVTGGITIGDGGYIAAGKDEYSSTTAGFFLGDDSGTQKFNIGDAAQFLTWDGSDLTITGDLTATTGSIGGWTIGTLDLTSSTGTVGLASAGTWRIWVGNATPSSAPFRVNSSGAMHSTSGSIGGWTINGITGLYLGSGSTTRGMDVGSIAFFAGASSPASAPFRVSTSGQLTATNINVTGGSVAGSTLTSGIPAGNITTGTLSADRIGASSIDATKLNVSTLSAVSANMGTITAGTITGGTITANAISTGTMTAARISGGNLGGDFNLGSSDIVLNSTGVIRWKSSASYIDNNQIVLDSSSSSDPAITIIDNSISRGFIYYTAGSSTLTFETRQDTVFPNMRIAAASDMTLATQSGDIFIIPQSGFTKISLLDIIGSVGGSASNWSGFGTANIPDSSAGYIVVRINGTLSRIPFYADG